MFDLVCEPLLDDSLTASLHRTLVPFAAECWMLIHGAIVSSTLWINFRSGYKADGTYLMTGESDIYGDNDDNVPHLVNTDCVINMWSWYWRHGLASNWRDSHCNLQPEANYHGTYTLNIGYLNGRIWTLMFLCSEWILMPVMCNIEDLLDHNEDTSLPTNV